MRLRQRPFALSLLLLYLSPVLTDAASLGHVADLAEGKAGRDTLSPPAPTPGPGGPTSQSGKKDAPVDGKDGRPHQGPFIETEAERDRKKAKEVGKDELLGPSEPLSKEGWNLDKTPELSKDQAKDLLKDMPKSNDGVMDDPNRQGPKEGTRGTEGGISEKSRGKLSAEDTSVEKLPEEPKAVPPLPHSEQEKMEGDTGKPAKSGKEEETTTSPKIDEEKEKPDGNEEDIETPGMTVRAVRIASARAY